jgi:hypothetical protein
VTVVLFAGLSTAYYALSGLGELLQAPVVSSYLPLSVAAAVLVLGSYYLSLRGYQSRDF